MSRNGAEVGPFGERPERVEELVLAGIGLSERKPKKFRKAVQRGRKAERKSNAYTGVLAQVHARVAGLRSARRRWRLVPRSGSAGCVSTRCRARMPPSSGRQNSPSSTCN